MPVRRRDYDRGVKKFLKGLGWTVGSIAVLLILARLIFFKVWRVPTDESVDASVRPTLEGGDLVLVLHAGTREVGDIVRCPHPETPTRWVVGRIYGVASDRVSVEGSFVQVNGRKYRTVESCVEDHVAYTGPGGVQRKLGCQRVDFAGGWHFIATADNGDVSTETTVGADKLYLVSDNRTDFFDSRDFGTVPASTCTEKVFFRLWTKEGFFSSRRRFEYLH